MVRLKQKDHFSKRIYISLAVGKEKAPAAEYDFQGFAQSWSGAFLKSEKSAYIVVFDSEFNFVSYHKGANT